MSGGGGGIIIIRSLLTSGRCTAEEIDLLNIIMNTAGVTLTVMEALTVARIVFRACQRP